LALAVFQIRVLLSAYLGSDSAGDMPVRQAAHLAYALHNEALATFEGRPADMQSAIQRIAKADEMLGGDLHRLFEQFLQATT